MAQCRRSPPPTCASSPVSSCRSSVRADVARPPRSGSSPGRSPPPPGRGSSAAAVLLLDEPLGALDKKLREAMQVELKSLQRQVGITAIFVTHDQEEALTLSDRIAVMHQGRIQQVGAPHEIYETPRTRFVAEFIGVCNFLEGKVIERGMGAVTIRTDGGALVAVGADAHGAPAEGVRSEEHTSELESRSDLVCRLLL